MLQLKPNTLRYAHVCVPTHMSIWYVYVFVCVLSMCVCVYVFMQLLDVYLMSKLLKLCFIKSVHLHSIFYSWMRDMMEIYSRVFGHSLSGGGWGEFRYYALNWLTFQSSADRTHVCIVCRWAKCQRIEMSKFKCTLTPQKVGVAGRADGRMDGEMDYALALSTPEQTKADKWPKNRYNI